MKKVFTFVMGVAMAMSSVTAMAETKTITSKAEFTAAIAAERTADGIDTLYIKPSGADNLLNIGSINPDKGGITCMKGTLVIIGIENELGEKPEIKTDWQFIDNTEADNFSLIIENCKLSYRSGATAESGQIFYVNKKQTFFQEFRLSNCEIYDYARTIFRTVPKEGKDDDGNAVKYFGAVHNFIIEDCQIHYSNIASGNTWACIVMGSPFDYCQIRRNTFYDLPYNKQIMSMSYIDPAFVESVDGIVEIENNDFFLATNQTNAMFQFDANIGQMSSYTFRNNIFMRPTWKGDYINERPSQTDSVGNVSYRQIPIFRASYGMVTIQDNIVDGTYASWKKGEILDEDGEGAWLLADTVTGIAPEAVPLTWDDMPFAQEGNFIRANTHVMATMGKDAEGNPCPMGNPNMYVDNMPVKALVNVTIVGSKSAKCAVTPAGPYFVGDEITITLDDRNSIYRTFNTFMGWSDGNTELERTIVLEGDLDLTAKFEEATGILSAFDFAEVSGNANLDSYSADMYFEYNDMFRAVAKMIVCDTTGYAQDSITPPFPEVYGTAEAKTFQARGAKFAEWSEETQMAIISRRVPAVVRAAGQNHYAQIEFCTKGMSGIDFSCYIGTDNMAFTTQIAEYSVDSLNWTKFATVDLVKMDTLIDGEAWTFGAWTELKGTLPAEAENQGVVYVRISSDYSTTPIINFVAGDLDPSADDSFEYIGNILLTYSSAAGIENLEADKAEKNAPIYDLMGRRVNKVEAGKLYIQAGKKFIVK